MGGMVLQFATCEVGRAINFINNAYKPSAELNPEDVPLLCDLLRRDIVRVQDPTFHRLAAIVLGPQGNMERDRAEIDAAVEQLKTALERLA